MFRALFVLPAFPLNIRSPYLGNWHGA